MSNIKTYNNFLKKTILYVEMIIYVITIFIILVSLALSVFNYLKHLINQDKNEYISIRIQISKSITLVLTFIICIEILKLYYIRTYKQLIIVCSVVILKLIISKFLNEEVKEISNQITNYKVS